jgi:hypothetical protein
LASLLGKGEKLLPKANRMIFILGSLEPAGPCLIPKECVWFPPSRAGPSLTEGLTVTQPAVAALEHGVGGWGGRNSQSCVAGEALGEPHSTFLRISESCCLALCWGRQTGMRGWPSPHPKGDENPTGENKFPSRRWCIMEESR